LQKKNAGDAIAQFQRALQIEPDSTEAHNNLGNVLRQTGKVDEAIAHFQRALELSPDDVAAHDNLGLAFRQTGKIDQAIAQFEAVIQLKPDSAEAHNSLGSALRQAGRVDEAIAHYQAALRLKSDYAEAHYNLGNAFMEQKNMGEAVFQFQQSLAVKPNQPNAENNLAWILATSPEASLRDGPKAVELAQQANSKLGGENPPILHTLAAAYAEAGRFPEAIDTAQRALGLAEKQGNDGLAHHLRLELQLYQARSAYHASE